MSRILGQLILRIKLLAPAIDGGGGHMRKTAFNCCFQALSYLKPA
jgi:hypothetical protein